MRLTESVVEDAAIDYLSDVGYDYLHGSVIAHDGESPERSCYGDVILADRLRAALARINPHLEADTLHEVAKRILRPDSPSLEENNLAFQTYLTRGVEVQVRKDGRIRGDQAWLIDFDSPATTTGWWSTSSRWSPESTTAARISWSSSTGSRLRSSN